MLKEFYLINQNNIKSLNKIVKKIDKSKFEKIFFFPFNIYSQYLYKKISPKKKVFGIAKISANLSSILNKKIKINLNKNKLNKKCFSYFDNLYKKINIYSIQFDKKNLNEINNLDDYKKTKRFY